jgi:geranylgeranyl pyrophosphate synthase
MTNRVTIPTDFEGLPSSEHLASLYSDCEDPWFAKLLANSILNPASDMSKRPSKRIRAYLVKLGYVAAQGESQDNAEAFQLERIGQAIELLHAGSLMIDDIQDQSPTRRGSPASHIAHGVNQTITSANWLYFWPLRLIAGIGLTNEQETRIRNSYLLALEKAHMGQALDLTVDITKEDQEKWQRIVETTTTFKTASITELAMSCGAVVANSDTERFELISRIGKEFGILLQHLDDLGNLFREQNADKICEDLIFRKPTWVWVLANKLGITEELIAMLATPEQLPKWSRLASIRELGLQLASDHQQYIHELCSELPSCSNKILPRSLDQLQEALTHAYLQQ